MQANGFAVLLTLFFASSVVRALEPALYHPDPNHLWNRLYSQVAVRTFEGQKYGADSGEPFPDAFDSEERLVATLDEFLSAASQQNLPTGVSRALLLNDLWTAFDVASAFPERNPALESRLARAVKSLRIGSAEVLELENNYRTAVESGRYARDFDVEHPETPFLPSDLFDPRGPWVQVGTASRGLVAPVHTQLVSGRSTFMVFIHCPGGREETLSYLSRLNLYSTPWQLNPHPLGVAYPGNQRVRMNVLRPDPNTPQLPRGTIVALVRQMMVLDEHLTPVPTNITQKVQFRVYERSQQLTSTGSFRVQPVLAFVMRRKDLIAQQGGGLRAFAADEREYQGLLVPVERNSVSYYRGSVVLSTCRGCHSGDGILGMRSYPGAVDSLPNPQLLPTATAEEQSNATISWKKL